VHQKAGERSLAIHKLQPQNALFQNPAQSISDFKAVMALNSLAALASVFKRHSRMIQTALAHGETTWSTNDARGDETPKYAQQAK